MCRAILYLGNKTPIAHFVYHPDNSLIIQSYQAKQMSTIQNLAGYGIAIWNDDFIPPNKPLIYKSADLPFYNKNLYSLCNALQATAVHAHVRGVTYTTNESISYENAHPYFYSSITDLTFSHNGALFGINQMKADLTSYIKPEIFNLLQGTTDSEWVYMIFLSRLKKLKGQHSTKTIALALLETMDIIRDVRKKRKIYTVSPLNLFVTNGAFLVALRFIYDYGHFTTEITEGLFTYHSLWYTLGREYRYQDDHYKMVGYPDCSSILIASEPLTENTSTWVPVPEYSLLAVERKNQQIYMTFYDVDV